MLLKDKAEAKCENSRTEKPDPIRAKLLTETEEPMWMQSKTDREDATCDMPKTENADPNRPIDRSDRQDPKSAKSRTDK
jgi:hypothetical protein